MNRNIAKPFTATLSLLDVATDKTHKYKCFHGEDVQLTVNVVGEENRRIDLSNTSVKIYFTLDKNVNEPVYRQDTGIVVDNLGIITVMLEKSYIRIGNNTLKIVLYDEDQTVFLQPLIISCIDPLIGEVADPEIPDDIDVRDELYDIRRIIGDLQDFDDDLGREIIEARNEYGTVGKRLDNFDSQLDNNTRQSVIKKINPKLLPPPYTRAIGDGVTNDTVAFNTALDLLCTRSDSNIIFETRCGVLELDEGVYVVDEILCRSNLTIRGQGMGKTILIPNINDIDKFFLDVKYTGENKLCNFELENLSILKTPSHQFVIEPVTGRQECSILNLTKCASVRIRNVIISGFKGNGILFKESFDTNIDNLQMIGCGDETHDAIMITSSESDGSNALHFNAIRVEGCSAINIEATGDRFNREIQFIGGKYEHVPFKIQGSSNVNFCGGHFTYGKIDTPLLRITTTAEAETYGINFTGCSFMGANTGYLANITPGANPPKFVGCSFKGFAKGFVGDNITLCTNEFYDMTAPIINSVANISADNNEFIYTNGTDGEYIFRIGANSNFNCNKIKYNANENLNGCLISGDGNHMTFNSFLTCDTGIRVEGSLNLLFGNKGSISEKEGVLANTLGHFSSLYVPTNSLDIPQNIRFNPTTNKLELFRKSSNSWGETYVRAGNVSNLAIGSTLETTITKINEILTALKNANIMIP